MAYNSKFTGSQIDELLDASSAMRISKEDTTNKVASLDNPSDATFPTTKAVKDYIDAGLSEKEDVSNKSTVIDISADDIHYPTTKSVLNAVSAVENRKITPEMLSESTKQFINASGGGTITNLADDEDLTSVDNTLKLADKDYSPTSYSGMGRVYLRKNIVGLTNILTQEMMEQVNTIYIIQYDYDLNGATINVPSGCVLDFQGGSLANGSINFNDCELNGNPKVLCQVSGSIKNGKINVLWFGVDNSGSVGVADRLQEIVNSYYDKVIYFPSGSYIIDNQVSLKKQCYFSGDGMSSILHLKYENGYNFIIESAQGNYSVVIEIKDLNVVGTGPSWYDSEAEGKKTNCSFLLINYPTAYTYRSLFQNLVISNVKNAITIGKCYWSRFINVSCYSYDIAFDLAEANSTSIYGCTFRGGFDRGLILRRSTNQAGAGIGVTLSGCDFSGNNYCGLQVLGQLINSSITGNYFESDPGYQIVIGGKESEKYSSAIELASSLIWGNGGLWSKGNDKDGIRVFKGFNSNLCNATVRFESGSSGKRNIGMNESAVDKDKYSEFWNYGTRYRNGVFDSWSSQVTEDIFRDVCVPANSSVSLGNIATRYFSFLYYGSSSSKIKLKVATIEATPVYLVGTEDAGQGYLEDEKGFWSIKPTDLGAIKNISFKLYNESESNIAVTVRIKYFKSIYGKQ